MGWHYGAYNGSLAVCVGSRGNYFCLLSDDIVRSGGGCCYWTESSGGEFDDPNDAVAYQAKLARAFLDKITPIVEHVESLVKGRNDDNPKSA